MSSKCCGQLNPHTPACRKLKSCAVTYLVQCSEPLVFKHPYRQGEAWDWMLVEKTTALLYLSLLAKYLSAIDEEATVPGTDRQEYRDLVYGTNQETEGEAAVQQCGAGRGSKPGARGRPRLLASADGRPVLLAKKLGLGIIQAMAEWRR
jgi:hypothetical protein